VRFEPPLRSGVLLRRYKRFLADVRLPCGGVVTMHCPNTGAMTGCAEPGSVAWYSTRDDARRKYRHTLEQVETASGARIGVHSSLANAIVAEALAAGVVTELARCSFRREVTAPGIHGRFDFGLLGEKGAPIGYVEVKSVTLAQRGGWGAFPDSRSERASRHVRALAQARRRGARAILLFCVQHTAIARVRPADDVDPAYGAALREAHAAGVEVLAYKARLDPAEITLEAPVDVVL
jgi:sugar fermentation stimulation protein A